MKWSEENKLSMVTRMLHHNMAIFGGFFAGYAILTRSDFLGNAQTSNLLYIIFSLLGRNWKEMLLRIGAVLIYFSAIILFVFIKNKMRINVKTVSLIINSIAIIIMGFMPSDINVILGLYPIFFSMSFQWNAFPGGDGFVSSTIFSTNNLRQFSLSIGEYMCDGDRKHLKKTFFFLGSLIGFHIGIVFAYFSVSMFGMKGVWMNFITLISASILLIVEDGLCNVKMEKKLFSHVA